MSKYKSITEVFEEIKTQFNATSDKSIVTLYSFNGVGKTRLSNKFITLNDSNSGDEEPKKKVLC